MTRQGFIASPLALTSLGSSLSSLVCSCFTLTSVPSTPLRARECCEYRQGDESLPRLPTLAVGSTRSGFLDDSTYDRQLLTYDTHACHLFRLLWPSRGCVYLVASVLVARPNVPSLGTETRLPRTKPPSHSFLVALPCQHPLLGTAVLAHVLQFAQCIQVCIELRPGCYYIYEGICEC